MAAVTQVRILVTALLHFFIAPPCPSERGARTRGKSTQGIEPNPLMTRTSREKKNYASAGNRTRINCLEGSYADHYTTDAQTPESVLSLGGHISSKWSKGLRHCSAYSYKAVLSQPYDIVMASVTGPSMWRLGSPPMGGSKQQGPL